jgi:H+/Cl- antiporter ClcA
VTRRNVEFSCAVVVIGLLAGLAGAATTVLLDFIEHLTYHYSFGSLLDGVTGSSRIRKAFGPTIGAVLAGLGWWWLRRRTAVPTVEQAILRPAPLPRGAMTLDAALQVLLVGSGASLGRENAPRQFAVALSDLGTGRWALTPRDREILLGCAAGAGLGAVYGVPIGGALFALRIVLRTWNIRAVITALVSSGLAALVAAPFITDGPALHWPNPDLSYLLIGVVVVLAPLTLGVGMAFSALMRRARSAAARRGPHDTWPLIPALAAAGLAVGLLSHWLPELPGNGSSVLLVSVERELSITAAAAILLLKPLLTAAFLRAGAAGGLITPALATGATLGALIALSVNAWTPQHLNVPAVALACAAAVLAITQGSPGWAAVFVWELASPPLWLMLVFGAAAYSTHLLHRRVTAPASAPASAT